MLEVDTAIQGKPTGGGPDNIAQHPGLPFIPLATLSWGIAGCVTGEGRFPVVFVAVVVELITQAQVVAHLPIEMHRHLLHVTVVAIVCVLWSRIGAASIQLRFGHETWLLGLVVIEAGY
ncbi:hypothetical protein D9M71_755510 [compost metagenome]